MRRILFVDDDRGWLDMIQLMLRDSSPDWELEFTLTAADALERMFKHPFDVVVSDRVMSGMDGTEMLTKVMQRYPNTIRIIMSGFYDLDTLMRLVGPAHQHLLKPFGPDKLVATIERALQVRDVLGNEHLKRLVSQVQSLPSIPSLYLELLEALRADEPAVEEIARIISHDLGMCTKLLQLVNSAYFGLAQQVTNVQEAVMYLGLQTIQALVLSLQIFSMFQAKQLRGFSLEDLWNHSWRVGKMARRIAVKETRDYKLGDQTFMAGMLHDVGKLVLVTGMPTQYREVLQLREQRKLPFWQAEQEVLGATHAEVGAYLLGLWGLPSAIVESVALHHRPSVSVVTEFCALTAVHAANAFDHEKETGKGSAQFTLVDLFYFQRIGLEDRLSGWRDIALGQCDND